MLQGIIAHVVARTLDATTVGAVPLLRASLSLYLRQHRFRCGEPEGHVHGTVHLDGGRERGAGQGSTACLAVQRAETVVTVRLQRAHAEFLGQGEGLAGSRLRLTQSPGDYPERRSHHRAGAPTPDSPVPCAHGQVRAPARRGCWLCQCGQPGDTPRSEGRYTSHGHPSCPSRQPVLVTAEPPRRARTGHRHGPTSRRPSGARTGYPSV